MTSFTQRRVTMVDTQVRPSDVTKYPIIEAMLAVPRELFVPASMRDVAYAGYNLPLGPDRVVLSPRTFAKMLDALDVGPHELVLDIGAGCGYSAAVLGQMAEAVVAVEEDAGFAAEAEAALNQAGADNVLVVKGRLTEGSLRHGPFDVIIIEGGIRHVPDIIGSQLKDGGRIACLFMRDELGTVFIGHKSGENVTWRFVFNASAPVLPGYDVSPEFLL